MSTLKTSNVQVGQSGTATNNFTLYQPTSPDGTVRLAVGNSGATTSDVMTVSNTGAVTFSGTVTASSFVGAGLILQSVQAISFAAAKGKSYPVNTTSGAVTVTLPAAPAAGDSINVFDYANTAATNNITISPNGGKISGGTNNLVLNTSGISVTLVYVDSTQGWEPVNYDAFQNLNGKSWTYFTSSGTYTVPAGVTSIRGYACGKGGNGAASGTGTPYGGSGGGGGMAYGDIAVTPGQTVTVTISAGVATLAIGATTYLTGNPGGNASTSTGGTAGTASKDASVTNGGAYSGGAGTNGSAQAGSGGASAGSPLGNGYSGAVSGGGGGGIGGAGGGSGGGGAGGAGAANFGGGAGGAASSVNPGAGRAFNARFTDPLLVNAVSPGGAGTFSGGTGTYAGPGGGGGSGTYPTPGGDFGGGGGQNGGPGAAGGLMGGGGGASSTAGNGGLGGGGGGTVSGQTAGTGGGAFVFIYA